MPNPTSNTVNAEPSRFTIRMPNWSWFLPAIVVLAVGFFCLWRLSRNHRERQDLEKIDESGDVALPAETKLAIERFTFDVSNIPTSVAFSPDGRSLFVGTGFWNAKVRSWDVVTGKLLHEVEVEEKVQYIRANNASFVLSIAPAKNNSTIAFGGRFTKRTSFATWDGESESVVEVAGVDAPVSVAPGLLPGEYFFAMSDGAVTSVDVSTHRVTQIGKMRSATVRLFNVPGAGLLFAVSETGELAAWNVKSGDRIDVPQPIAGFDVTRDGRRIAVIDRLGNLILYEFDGQGYQFQSQREFDEPLFAVNWSHDASHIAVINVERSSADDQQTDSERSAPLIAALDATGNAQQAVVSRQAEKHILRVLDTSTWTETETGIVDEDVVTAVFSPVALVLAVIHGSGGPTVVDLQTREIRRLDPPKGDRLRTR
jgi:WD40 repeat protein